MLMLMLLVLSIKLTINNFLIIYE